jgi:hypothetical protein
MNQSIENNDISDFDLKLEIIRVRSELITRRKNLDEKKDIYLRLTYLTEELKINTAECENLKRKIEKAEREAKLIFGENIKVELTN